MATAQTSPRAAVWIESSRGWFELRLRELWMYHELLYFMIWRDLK
jgi:lipopolysaccharide transport system permease protein